MNNLRKLIADNAAAQGRFEIQGADSDEATVYLYSAIGWLGIEAESFVPALNDIESPVINLRINSPGGDVFDARSIATAIRQHPARVVSHVDGLAASAATFIAIAGDEVVMAEGSFFMIHNPWTLALGDANDLRQVADTLDKVGESILQSYANQSSLDAEALREMMDAETWMTAEEAVENGFANRVAEEERAVEASWKLGAYASPPAALLEPPKPKAPESAVRAAQLRKLTLYERTA